MGKKNRPELLPGTLDLLILQTLAAGSQHGYGIALHLKTVSDDVCRSARARCTRPCNASC